MKRPLILLELGIFAGQATCAEWETIAMAVLH